MVVKGTAPLDDLSQIKKFKKNPVLRQKQNRLDIKILYYIISEQGAYPKTMPGYRVAVRKAARFHSRPFIVL